MNNHLYLRIIKRGLEVWDTFTLTDFVKDSFSQEECIFLWNLFHYAKDAFLNSGNVRDNIFTCVDLKDIDNECIFALEVSAIFHYYDYLELQEARLNSSKAQKNANWSIIISMTALLFSIIIWWYSVYYSYIQINTPVKIWSPIILNEKQFNELTSYFQTILDEIYELDKSNENYNKWDIKEFENNNK
jgi:hypothetical protein